MSWSSLASYLARVGASSLTYRISLSRSLWNLANPLLITTDISTSHDDISAAVVVIDTAGCAVSAPVNLGTLVKANEEVLQQCWLDDLVLYLSVHFSTQVFIFPELWNISVNSKVCWRKLNVCFKWAEKCRSEPIGLAIAMSVTWKPSLVGVLFYSYFFASMSNYPVRN